MTLQGHPTEMLPHQEGTPGHRRDSSETYGRDLDHRFVSSIGTLGPFFFSPPFAKTRRTSLDLTPCVSSLTPRFLSRIRTVLCLNHFLRTVRVGFLPVARKLPTDRAPSPFLFQSIQTRSTQEYVNGQLKNKYGDAFIRGNNVMYISTVKDK